MKVKAAGFKRIAVGLLLAGAIIAFAAFRYGPTPAAAANPASNACGLKGTYGYVGTGNTFDGNALGFPTGLVSTMGTITLDGNGNWSVREVEVVNGATVNSDAMFSGIYTVSPDCTFAGTIPGLTGGGLEGVAVDQGKQIRAISTIPGVQVNYVATVKVSP
jgi:hypothetical protein